MPFARFAAGRLVKGVLVLFAIAVLNFFLIRAAPGPVLYVAKVRAEPLQFALPPKDGAHLKDRFRQALLEGGASS